MVIGFIEWVFLVDFKRNVDVNLWGLIDVIKIFLFLVKKVKGWVVFVGSVVGILICNRLWYISVNVKVRFLWEIKDYI